MLELALLIKSLVWVKIIVNLSFEINFFYNYVYFQVENFSKVHADFGNKLTKALAQYKKVSFKLAKTTSIENEDTQFIKLSIPVRTVTLQNASCNISSLISIFSQLPL